MTLALLCQFTAQHVSDANTSISGACYYLCCCCVGWLEGCWCYVAGLVVGDVISECRLLQPALGYHITNSQSRCFSLHSDTTSPTANPAASACTRISHHQQPIPLHNTNTPQVSLHNNTTSSRKLLKMDVLASETCWAVNWHNKVSVIKLVYLYSNTIQSYCLMKMTILIKQ